MNRKMGRLAGGIAGIVLVLASTALTSFSNSPRPTTVGNSARRQLANDGTAAARS